MTTYIQPTAASVTSLLSAFSYGAYLIAPIEDDVMENIFEVFTDFLVRHGASEAEAVRDTAVLFELLLTLAEETNAIVFDYYFGDVLQKFMVG